jgi:hypothetical protein
MRRGGVLIVKLSMRGKRWEAAVAEKGPEDTSKAVVMKMSEKLNLASFLLIAGASTLGFSGFFGHNKTLGLASIILAAFSLLFLAGAAHRGRGEQRRPGEVGQ